MNASAGTGVFVLSLLSIPVSYLFNYLIYSNSVCIIILVSLTVFIILMIPAKALLRKRAPTDPLFYVYALSACLSVINLIIGLEQDGVIDGFMTFYLKHADPYINTAHGHMMSYWDGCAHYLMYLLMVAAITWGASYRAIGSYWVGSILMRIVVYIPGNIVGKYGVQLNSLFLLHVLYVCVLVWACFRLFSQPASLDPQQTNILEEQKKTIFQRPVDIIFIIFLLVAVMFCIFRGLVVLDCPADWCQQYAVNYEPYLRDPSAYPRIQTSAWCILGQLHSLEKIVLNRVRQHERHRFTFTSLRYRDTATYTKLAPHTLHQTVCVCVSRLSSLISEHPSTLERLSLTVCRLIS